MRGECTLIAPEQPTDNGETAPQRHHGFAAQFAREIARVVPQWYDGVIVKLLVAATIGEPSA